MVDDLNTFTSKAVPDTKLTLKKYLDVKFEYLVSFDEKTRTTGDGKYIMKYRAWCGIYLIKIHLIKSLARCLVPQ